METFRDAAVGKLLRLLSRKRWLRYPEESDPSIWTQYYLETNQDGQVGSATQEDQDGASEPPGTETHQRTSGSEKTHLEVGWRSPVDSEVGLD